MIVRALVVSAGAMIVAASAIALISSDGPATPAPPPPGDARVYEMGDGYVKVTWGPSAVGPLSIEPARDGRSATIRWGAASDSLNPAGIRYEFSKNNKILWADRLQTFAVVGFTLAVRQFSTCVRARSDTAWGPERCVTWKAPA